jgi:HK97 family phage prohead protease
VTERMTFDATPETVFADLETRVIRGLAVPTGEIARSGGRLYRFAPGSITFAGTTPLLQYHDQARPVGRLSESRWSKRGLEVAFAVSKTEAGDEALVLASDGVVGLSVGIDIEPDGATMTDDIFEITCAAGREISITPLPAFSGAQILSVALHENTNTEGVTVTTAPEVTPVTVQLDAAQLGESIAAAFAALPQPQPVPIASVSHEEPLYRFTGEAGRHSFIGDLRDAHRGDSAAAQRLDEHLSATFAVTTGNAQTLNPKTNRADLYVDQLRYTRPLGSLVSTGTLTDGNPFTIPKFATAAGLVGPHVEGTEPTPGSFTVTDQTITPAAISGKAEINREAFDRGGNPALDMLVWNEMVAGYYESLEASIAATLDALTLIAVDITGTDDAAVDGLSNVLIAAQFARGGNRLSALALNSDLFTALAQAADGDGRKLLPLLAPANADGQISSGFGRLAVGGLTGVPAYGLSTHSYLFVPTSVYQFASAPRRFDFDVRVKSVDLAIWGYHAEFVTRTADVKRLDYAAA